MRTPLKTILGTALVAATAAFAAGGAAGATSPPSNTTPPSISGTPAVGQTLTASNGAWSGTPTSYAYQWLRCTSAGGSCVSVSGATSKTYKLVTADAGHAMRVRVTATNAGGSASAESAETSVVTSPSSPKNTAAPTITGTAQVGNRLSADPGTWSGGTATYAYDWQRCDADVVYCTDVPGATGSTYGVTNEDLGYRLRVVVTAKNANGTGVANSAATAIVEPVSTPTAGPPKVTIVSVRFVGAAVYARFRVCSQSLRNVAILETDSRPGRLSYNRTFSTLTTPLPCGVYDRHWVPAARFRGPGRYTLTLRAREQSGATSLPARRSFTHG